MPALPAAAQLSSIYVNSLPFLGAAFGIGLFLAVIQLYFSRILNDPGMKSRASESLSNVIDTVVLLGGFTFLVWATSYVISAMAGVPYSETIHLELASISIEKFLSLAETSYVTLYVSDAIMSVFFALHIPLPLHKDDTAGTTLAIQPLVGLHGLFGYISTVMNLVIMNFLGVIARKYLISMAPYLLTFLLPFAVLFRGMNFTKSLGSALFALVITLYYVYPLSVLFTDYLIFTQFTPALLASSSPLMELPVADLAVPGYANINDFRQAAEDYREFATSPEVADIFRDVNPYETVQEFTSKTSLWTQVSSKVKSFLTGKGISFAGAFAAGVGGDVLETALQNTNNPKAKFFAKAGVVLKYAAIAYALYAISPVDTALSFLDLVTKVLLLSSYSAVLFLLALVFEILISLTAYKQLAEVLGGEPLLFGLTKVV